MSGFHSLEVARQAIFAQQSALHTTSHNIANANTKGYSRQRVNFEQVSAFPSGSRNRPEIAGQIGAGVKAGSIERIRNDFLDTQFRTENSQAGYWQELGNALGRVEGLMNEPSETGLSASLDEFWNALQDLADSPDNTGARSVVLQRGAALSDTFVYFHDTISGFREDIKGELETTADEVNSILTQIHDINQQVARLEPHGYSTNDLYDKRDQLIDELSGMIDIEVTKNAPGESSLRQETADGLVSIELKRSDGSSTGIKLIDGDEMTYNEVEVNFDESADGEQAMVSDIQVGGTELGIQEIESLGNGSLKAMFEVYNDEYSNILSELDEMAYHFASKFNEVHEAGHTLDGESGIAFFGGMEDGNIEGFAGRIFVSIEDTSDIAASAEPNGGASDNSNIRDLLAVFDAPLEELSDTSVQKFYESLIGEMAVKTQQANQMVDSTGVLRAQVDQQRQSVSAVSLDEEMTNMIQFQHAYNAAARNMTAIDEMLDRVINNMGLVGR